MPDEDGPAGGSMGSESSAGGVRKSTDPFVGLRFYVDLGDDIYVGGFTECSAMTIETETIDYAEGGNNTYLYKLPVRTKYSNITLKRGFDDQHDLFEWYTHTINGSPLRKDITITLFTVSGQVARKWHLRRAYPVKWIGPDLKASSGAIAVESIEIAHEGLLPDSTTSGPPESAPRYALINEEAG
jgi:phage tail-like protein